MARYSYQVFGGLLRSDALVELERTLNNLVEGEQRIVSVQTRTEEYGPEYWKARGLRYRVVVETDNGPEGL